MTNPVTPNIGLNKIDRTSPSTTYFDLEKYIDQNADAVDQFAGETKQSLDSLASRLDTEERREVVLQPGLQVVHAERTAPFSLSGIKGRTLVNLLGRDGRLNRLSQLIQYNLTAVADQDGAKITLEENMGALAIRPVRYERGKKYILLAEAKNGTISGEIIMQSVDSEGETTSLMTSVDSTQFRTIASKYAPMHDSEGSAEAVCIGKSGQYAWLKNFRVYEISLEDFVELDLMSPEEIAMKYPYVDSIQSVSNPYAIRYGENLLDPLVYGEARSSGKFTSMYEWVDNAESAIEFSNIEFKVKPHTEYCLHAELYNASHAIYLPDLMTPVLGYSTENIIRFNSGDNNKLEYTFKRNSDSSAYLKNPMLVIGNEPKPFKSREDSMLAFQTELHANPKDGSDPDVLFEYEGQYYKQLKWRRVEILPDEIEIGTLEVLRLTGYVQISLDLPRNRNTTNYDSIMTKYDGIRLNLDTFNSPLPAADVFNVGNTDYGGRVWLTVSNENSGWGDNYTPSPDEIKAYFMGWKMYDASTNSNGTGVFNGSGLKNWVRISSWVGDMYIDGGYRSVPTNPAKDYTPYQLLYRIATHTVEPVVSEGCLTLKKGDNLVEVGTGIVLRESVRVNSTSEGFSYTNADYPFHYKPYDIKEVYNGNSLDPNWKVGYRLSSDQWYSRLGRAFAYIPTVLYDPSVAYSVTYLKLDKSPIQPISGSLAASEKSQISDLTKGVAKALQRVSVVEMKKAEKGSPGWIAPTLLNGWVRESTTFGYVKDPAGNVRFRGRISSGATASGTLLFTLPVGVRPTVYGYYQVTVNTGASLTTGFIMINVDGTVVISYFPGNTWINWDTVSFLAEQ